MCASSIWFQNGQPKRRCSDRSCCLCSILSDDFYDERRCAVIKPMFPEILKETYHSSKVQVAVGMRLSQDSSTTSVVAKAFIHFAEYELEACDLYPHRLMFCGFHKDFVNLSKCVNQNQ